MTVFEVLFPIIVIIYLLDCLVFVKKHQVKFFTILGDRFWLKQSGLCLMGVFPLSEVVDCVRPPFSLTKNGLHFFPDRKSTRNNQPESEFIAFRDIKSLEIQENKVKINRSSSFTCPDGDDACKAVALIRELNSLGPQKLQQRAQELLFESTDLKEIRRIRLQNKRQLYFLSLFSMVFFVLLFILLPVFLYTDLKLYLHPLGMILSLVISYLAIITLAMVSLKHIIGINRKKARFSTFLMVLSPITSLHISKELIKSALSGFDFLALTAVLLPSGEFKYLMREELLTISAASEKPLSPEWQEYWEQREKKSLHIMRQKGITTADLFASPVKQDRYADKYCPLCLAEYSQAAGHCTTCGILLKNFERD